MKRKTLKPLKCFALKGIAILVLTLKMVPATAQSLVQSVDAVGMGGMYMLEGKTATKRAVSLSGVGVYKGQVEVGAYDHFRAYLGLTYLLSDGFQGDTAWGFDFGVKYFPWSFNGMKSQNYDGVSFHLLDSFRPYVGLGLRSMEFATVLSTSYTGFGIIGGTHYTLDEDYYLIGEGQYNTLSGSNENSVNEMYFMIGVGIRLK